jgi:Zn-dependent protease
VTAPARIFLDPQTGAPELRARALDAPAPFLHRTGPLTIAGVPLEIDVSWPFALVLGAWTLASTVMPEASAERSALAHWAAGASASLLLLASLALHEVAHCRAARRRGVTVMAIRLSVVGGVTELADAPASPAAEFRIAIAGPIASFAAALAAAVAHVVLEEVGADPLLAAVAAVVAAGNLVLALLNLAPGLPLDGGRVVRAALWGLTGNAGRATHVAAAIGRGLGATLLALALLASAWGDVAVGIWAALLGAVIYRGAGEE